MQPIPIFLPGKPCEWRSLVLSPWSYSPWGRRELNTAERLTHRHLAEQRHPSSGCDDWFQGDSVWPGLPGPPAHVHPPLLLRVPLF